MRKTSRHLFVVVIAIVALFGASLVVLAQDQPTMTGPATTKTKPKTHKAYKAKSMGRCDRDKQEQTDLSGTYTGKLTHGDQPTEDATLTIAGNNLTVTSGSETHTGRISAETTCGYTGATVMMDGPSGPTTVSFRAKKMGDKLTLTSLPEEKMHVTFVPTGAKGTAKHKHKSKPKTKKTEATPPAAKQ